MSNTVVIPGGRDVRATRDAATDPDPPETLIVACPPHPLHGGSRHDRRLRAIAEAVTEAGVDCLRLDYGAYDAGRGECSDVERTVEWAYDRAECVGLVGYSFGGAVALCAAGRGVANSPTNANSPTDANSPTIAGVVALAPPPQLPVAAGADYTLKEANPSTPEGDGHGGDERETTEWSAVTALSALTGSDCAVDVVYGTRDVAVETGPVVDATQSAGGRVVGIDTDHGFTGCLDAMTDVVVDAVGRWR